MTAKIYDFASRKQINVEQNNLDIAHEQKVQSINDWCEDIRLELISSAENGVEFANSPIIVVLENDGKSAFSVLYMEDGGVTREMAIKGLESATEKLKIYADFIHD